MISLDNFIITVGGFDKWVFEDMVEETITLLKDLAASIHNPQQAAEILIQRFNDIQISDPILYHFRLLASSWLKSIPGNYEGFIPGELGIGGYSKEWLEAPNQEIDHLGMQLVIDVLMKPIGIAVEIVYLDRSEGSQVNSHMFQAEDANGNPTNGPIVHLLYRPSHYDILYKDRSPSISLQQPVGEAIPNANLQVNRATNFSQHHNVQHTPAGMNGYSNLDMTNLLSIPGFGPPPPSHHGFPGQYSPIEQPYTASPISASPVSPGPSPVANSSTSGLSLSTTFPPQQSSTLVSPSLNTPHSAHATFPSTTQLPIHSHSLPPQSQPIRASLSSHPSLVSHNSDLSSPVSANSSFRPSKYEWEAAADWQEGPVVFQTSTFKNSHYNTAHYNNPNFQPEEWSPECDEAVGAGSGTRKRSS
jgi:ubiquitin thioesterase protein OTUB1